MRGHEHSTPNREVYIQDCSVDAALEWIRTMLSDLSTSTLPGSNCIFCEGRLAGTPTKVILGMMEDNFLSIYLACPPFPWRTDVEFARSAYAALGRTVRCDPGELRRHEPQASTEWWSVGLDGEGLIFWP
jgi:hypothetical protein